MMTTRDETEAIFAGEVRGLQSLYPRAHRDLKNWGLWSRDRSGIYPTLSAPSIFDQFNGDSEGYAEAEHEWIPPKAQEVKAERAETDPYSEKEANEVDEYLHQAFDWPRRKCLVVAYVTVEVPEIQFPKLARCSHEEFLRSLADILAGLEGR